MIKPYDINFPYYTFCKEPTTPQLYEVSEHYLDRKEYKKEMRKIMSQLKRQNIQERKH